MGNLHCPKLWFEDSVLTIFFHFEKVKNMLSAMQSYRSHRKCLLFCVVSLSFVIIFIRFCYY